MARKEIRHRQHRRRIPDSPINEVERSVPRERRLISWPSIRIESRRFGIARRACPIGTRPRRSTGRWTDRQANHGARAAAFERTGTRKTPRAGRSTRRSITRCGLRPWAGPPWTTNNVRPVLQIDAVPGGGLHRKPGPDMTQFDCARSQHFAVRPTAALPRRLAADMQNADCILIMGSNMAECHPVAFRWVMKAKTRLEESLHARFTPDPSTPDLGDGEYPCGQCEPAAIFTPFCALIRYAIEQYDLLLAQPAAQRDQRAKFFLTITWSTTPTRPRSSPRIFAIPMKTASSRGSRRPSALRQLQMAHEFEPPRSNRCRHRVLFGGCWKAGWTPSRG